MVDYDMSMNLNDTRLVKNLNSAPVDVEVHEIKAPGIFKIIPRYDIPQNHECAIRVYHDRPDQSKLAKATRQEDLLNVLDARISALNQEITRLNKQVDELLLCRDTASYSDTLREQTTHLGDLIRLAFVGSLGPLSITFEVSYVEISSFSKPLDVPKFDCPVNTTDATQSQGEPEDSVVTINDALPPQRPKRKRDPETPVSTPTVSDAQNKTCSLERRRKRQRLDGDGDTKEASAELPDSQHDLLTDAEELGNTLESTDLPIDGVSAGAMKIDVDERDADAWWPKSEDSDGRGLNSDERSLGSMVTEYASEIVAYLKEAEKAAMPDPDYIYSGFQQPAMTWDDRRALVRQVIAHACHFKAKPETLFLCVNIIDRYFSKSKTTILKENRPRFVLFAYSVASKFEDTAISRSNLSDESVVKVYIQPTRLLAAELAILETIDWNVSAPGPMMWLRRGSAADQYDSKSRYVAKYLLTVSCMDERMLRFVPSLVATAALWLGRLCYGRMEWTPNLVHHTTYTEEELLPAAGTLLEFVLKFPDMVIFPHSDYFRHWALQWWAPKSKVDWEVDLLRIKTGNKDEIQVPNDKKDVRGQPPIAPRAPSPPEPIITRLRPRPTRRRARAR